MKPSRRILFCAAALMLLASPLASAAQDPVPEPDPAALYRTAQVLEADGEYELADALMDYILRRYPESSAAAAIRSARARPGTRRAEDSGRTELLVWGTLYGLWLGIAVPGTMGAEDPEPYGLGLLMGGPAGFLVTRSLTDGRPIGDGDAGLITWAGTWGTWQGFGWAQVLDLGAECPEGLPEPCFDGPSSESIFGLMAAGGLAGAAFGAVAASRWQPSPGDATTVNLASLWGTWFSVALGVIAEVEGDGLMATTLVGGNLGALAGVGLANRYPVSRSEARIASIIGVAGGLAGAGIDLLVQPENEKVAIGIPLAASALALGAGIGRLGGDEPEAPAGGPEASSGADWRIGGPLIPRTERGPGGERRTALGVTLLSARF